MKKTKENWKKAKRRWKKANPEKWLELRNNRERICRWGMPIYLNNWFEGSSIHHMEKQIAIYIPVQLHQSVQHALVKGTNMLKMNGLAMAWFEASLQQALEVSNGSN